MACKSTQAKFLVIDSCEVRQIQKLLYIRNAEILYLCVVKILYDESKMLHVRMSKCYICA